ncbi:hypothetical protein Agabi119p4_3977 [Agaricus bisporus var. burnettii]|uniref:alcohol dehydrogenase n=1 Tax=Agaricus bisporus var. burnettii TaxID=192524 RepID=A0A8H7F5U3_AGABI|nr:hypothetical protein Agabi119p4_3977 [Agaricus bisporus var. burnettii]
MSSKLEIPKTQRAAVLYERKGEYRIEKEWPVTQPHELKPGQCLVKMEYTGVCHSDLTIKNRDSAPPNIPLIGGHEGVGVIVAIGEHTQDPIIKIGDRVGLKYIAKICETCEMCRSGKESLCISDTEKLTHGYQIGGTFQEYVLSYTNYVSKIPDGIDSAGATPLFCAGVTVYKAIKTLGGRLGQWVAISGAGGGLGHLAVQFAVAQGLRVIAIDTGEDKKELVLSLGAEKWIDFKESKDLVADVQLASGGLGPHAAVIATGNPQPFFQAALYLRPTGTIMCIGVPAGLAPLAVPIALIVLKGLNIIGTLVGSRLDIEELLAIVARGKVKCHYETRSLEDLNTVFSELEAGKITGRIILKI